ncbi:hypothetical protein PHMEG_00026272 [Phytophthora megakarya]|uniref:Uncharacterized protein n=1 Tax=Phytophthora megakarya TaxID=4795 RepID=A0A225V9Z9_9STRA|nr:hypothetical protein PHMEG_00026272 [Phytophthora megakarya]
MGIAYMLGPATDLDDFVDDDEVDNQICEMAARSGVLTPTTGIAKLTAEILEFKSSKRRGGSMLRLKYSESRSKDVDLARYQSRPESVELDHQF